VDGAELSVLYTLHDRLPGNPVRERGLQHCEPTLRSLVDEKRPDGGSETDAPRRSGGELFAGGPDAPDDPGFESTSAQKTL
jgi:hypothetical protein